MKALLGVNVTTCPISKIGETSTGVVRAQAARTFVTGLCQAIGMLSGSSHGRGTPSTHFEYGQASRVWFHTTSANPIGASTGDSDSDSDVNSDVECGALLGATLVADDRAAPNEARSSSVAPALGVAPALRVVKDPIAARSSPSVDKFVQ